MQTSRSKETAHKRVVDEQLERYFLSITSYPDKPLHFRFYTSYVSQNSFLRMATLLTQETAAKSTHQAPTTTVYEKGLQVGDDVNRITKIETFRVRPRWLFVRVETSKVSLESAEQRQASDRDRTTLIDESSKSALTCRASSDGEKPPWKVTLKPSKAPLSISGNVSSDGTPPTLRTSTSRLIGIGFTEEERF